MLKMEESKDNLEEEESLEKTEKEPLTKKQEINNHIVLMRKSVRQARVHVINKLTKEVKRLKERKGDEDLRKKAARKAERLLEEIMLIKHIKEDKISIHALQNSKKLEEVVQNIQSTLEDRAFARLSYHPAVVKKVKQYRDGNPHWQLQIPVLLEKSKEKRKQMDKKLAEREAMKKSGNMQPILLKKANLENLSNASSDNDNSSSETEGIDHDESEHKSLETEPVNHDVADSSKVLSVSKLQKLKSPKAVMKKARITVPKKPKRKPTQETSQKKVTNSVVEKSVGTIRVQLLKDLTDLEDKPVMNEVKVAADNLDDIPKKKPKSSFFVGGEDEPEVESDVFRKSNRFEKSFNRDFKDPQRSHSGESKPVFRKGKLISQGKNPKSFPRTSGPMAGRPSPNTRHFGNDDSYSSNLIPLGDKSARKPSKDLSGQGSNSNRQSSQNSQISDEKLHPSWEAKKRQQVKLSTFEGKKITFNDD